MEDVMSYVFYQNYKEKKRELSHTLHGFPMLPPILEGVFPVVPGSPKTSARVFLLAGVSPSWWVGKCLALVRDFLDFWFLSSVSPHSLPPALARSKDRL
jgi:hypothetical protein